MNPRLSTRNPKPETGNLSIYLHIPFCLRLCPYCHFYRVPDVPHWREYLDAVTREIHPLANHRGRSVRTFYAGGGTPTLLPPEFYDLLFQRLGEGFDMTGAAESTIETDEVSNIEELAGYAQAGFDRVSIGVKSFDLRVRALIGAGDLVDCDPVATAREAGFSSVNLDLIYGIQGQGMKNFTADLERTVESGPDHISLYALEEQEEAGPRESDPDLAADMFRESLRVLTAAGYRQYEITNFALIGLESLHNTVYWEDGDYIGLGPSAHSSVTENGTRIRWRNRPDLEAYLRDPGDCREELSRQQGEDRAREALILGLRMTKGVQRAAFARRYGFDPLDLIKAHLADLMAGGLVRFSADKVRLTTRGMLLSNEVFVRILES